MREITVGHVGIDVIVCVYLHHRSTSRITIATLLVTNQNAWCVVFFYEGVI